MKIQITQPKPWRLARPKPSAVEDQRHGLERRSPKSGFWTAQQLRLSKKPTNVLVGEEVRAKLVYAPATPRLGNKCLGIETASIEAELPDERPIAPDASSMPPAPPTSPPVLHGPAVAGGKPALDGALETAGGSSVLDRIDGSDVVEALQPFLTPPVAAPEGSLENQESTEIRCKGTSKRSGRCHHAFLITGKGKQTSRRRSVATRV
jgi:hypothetical protein